MRKTNSKIGIAAVICILIPFGVTGCSSKDVCIKSGCYRESSYGSNYCYFHKPKSYSGLSSSGYYTGSSENSSDKGNTSSSYSSSWNSYDTGYDDVYDYDDYDWDRYDNDPDYADGVDDAMDELDW